MGTAVTRSFVARSAATSVADEAAAFARTVAQVMTDHPVSSEWRPDSPGDDRCAALTEALALIGWAELAEDPDALAFVAPAALELGRGLAPLSEVDRLLGASPLCGGLTRYPESTVVGRVPEGLRYTTVLERTPLAYGDDQAVHRVRTADTGAETVPAERERAWVHAQVGYLAGLAAGAFDLALDHVRQRSAFGAPLAALPNVQARLADAATAATALRLLAEQPRLALDALAFAGQAAETVVAQCHQVVGAIGFTLEFPLQRYSRRVRTLAAWNDAWVQGSLA